MDFEKAESEAKDWIKTSKSNVDLFNVDKKSQKLDFQIPSKDISFYIQMTTDENQIKWHLWSNVDTVLSKIQPAIEDVTSGRISSLGDILSRCLSTISPSKDSEQNDDDDENDDNAEDDNDDDSEVDDYYGEPEEFDDDLGATKSEEKDEDSDLEDSESFFGPMNAATGAAIQRLRKDLKNIYKVGPDYGIIAKPRGDNLFYWDVKLTDVPSDSQLGKDLKQYSVKYEQEPVLNLEMQFPQDYPFNPPFIRVLKPRFKFLTGHVTIGGSICMEMLTKSGWVPSNDIESILVQVRAEIMSDKNASLDTSRPNEPYTEREARDAFNRMVNRYGWNK